MLALRKTTWGRQAGVASAVYLILYAMARIAMECFREPDSTVYVELITKGQLYSLFMILAGILILLRKSIFRVR
jgi:prolipoprotein diacylglyceryltransferase